MHVQSNQASAITKLWISSTSLTKKVDLSFGAIHGIAFTEYLVLQHLMSATNKVARRIDLAESMQRSASAITKMLTPMEKIGLIEKQVNPRDARESLVKITEAGEKVFIDASETLNQRSKVLLQRLESDHLNNLVEVLNILNET